MYFPYSIWKDAEREAKRMPPSNDPGGIGIFSLMFMGLLIYAGISASIQTGSGTGILLTIACIVGFLQGVLKK